MPKGQLPEGGAQDEGWETVVTMASIYTQLGLNVEALPDNVGLSWCYSGVV